MEMSVGDTYKAVFESSNGYNVSARLGRIYEFTCSGVSAYICIVNPDLRDVSFWLRHFVRLVRHKMRLRILVRRITLDDLMMREIGLTTMRQLMEKYLN